MLPIIVTKARLLVQETDSAGYTTYVFLVLDQSEVERLGTRYLMCTRWPNWDHRFIKNYEEGYLSITEIRAGIDEWFDGEKFVKYNYNNIQFNQFINKQQDYSHNFKM